MTALIAPPRERAYRTVLRAVRFMLHLCTRRTQRGDEHLPAAGAVIVAGNQGRQGRSASGTGWG